MVLYYRSLNGLKPHLWIGRLGVATMSVLPQTELQNGAFIPLGERRLFIHPLGKAGHGSASVKTKDHSFDFHEKSKIFLFRKKPDPLDEVIIVSGRICFEIT